MGEQRTEDEIWAEVGRIERGFVVFSVLLAASAVALIVSMFIANWWLWVGGLTCLGVCWLWSKRANRRLDHIRRELGWS